MTERDQGHTPRRVHAFLAPTTGGSIERSSNARSGVLRPVATAIVSAFVLSSAVLLGIGFLLTHVLEHGFIGVWDHHVIDWFAKHSTKTDTRVSGVLTAMADTITVCAVAAVVSIALVARGWGRQSLIIVAGLVVELSVFLTVNSIVARPRPSVRHLGGTPSTYSFPSGHTAATIVLYGGIAVIVTAATAHTGARVIAWLLAGLLTVAVALSRVYRGEHYPTDVIGGALLGVFALTSAIVVIRIASAHLVRSAPSGRDHASSTMEMGSAT